MVVVALDVQVGRIVVVAVEVADVVVMGVVVVRVVVLATAGSTSASLLAIQPRVFSWYGS